MPVFHYEQHIRTQLWFKTPNCCGAFLAMLLIVVCGFHEWLYENIKARCVKLAMSVICYAGILVLMCFVASSYSRGAYIATIAGLGMFAIMRRSRLSITYFILFCGVLLCYPDANVRTTEIIDIQSGSIHNRFLIWHGACGILANFPITGIPLADLGDFYTAWFQPLDFEAVYRTVHGDWLTLTCVVGIPCSAMLNSMILWPWLIEVWNLATQRHKQDGCLQISCTSALFSYLISGLFNTYFIHWDVFWLPTLLWLCLCMTVLARHVTNQARDFIRPLMFSGFFSFLLVVAAYAHGKFLLSTASFKNLVKETWISSHEDYHVEANEEHGKIIMFLEKNKAFGDSLTTGDGFHDKGFIRRIVRPCLDGGLSVQLVSLSEHARHEDIVAKYHDILLQDKRPETSVLFLEAHNARHLLSDASIHDIPLSLIVFMPEAEDATALRDFQVLASGRRARAIILYDNGRLVFNERQTPSVHSRVHDVMEASFSDKMVETLRDWLEIR